MKKNLTKEQIKVISEIMITTKSAMLKLQEISKLIQQHLLDDSFLIGEGTGTSKKNPLVFPPKLDLLND